MYYPKFSSVAFSVHNGESLFSFWIPIGHDSLPEVTTTFCGQMDEKEYIGLGTSHAIRSKWGSNEAVFMTFVQSPQVWALRSFAGITDQPPSAGSRNRFPVIERLFKAPHLSGGGAWEVDEESGRVVSTLRGKREQFAVMYF